MADAPTPRHYVDGEWSAVGDETIAVQNPATEATIAEIPVATDTEVETALEAASHAQSEWSKRPGIERANVLREIGSVVAEATDDVADVLVAEQGKPAASARSEIAATADLANYVAGWGRRIEGDIVPSDNRRESIHLTRHPLGVVAGIIPWNYPISVFMRKLLPALIAGNAVVLKPSELTPLSTVTLVEHLDAELDLPDGLINVVIGDGSVGEQLVTSSQTDMVTMTGSTDTGKAIMRAAADTLTPVSLELGGKAPAIIAADADLEAAVEDTLTARITNAGQVCTCAERIYVDEDVAEEFTAQYVEAARDVTLGDPQSNPDMGPQVSAGELEKTAEHVDRAVKAGANVRLGGGRPTGEAFEHGYWYEPTVLTDVSQTMDVVQQEVFGPVTPIIPVSSVEEAIEYANDSEYGLSSYVYTTDHATAMRAAEDLEYGETYINRTLGEAWQGHHIGWKASGLGGEDGKYGVLKYTQLKTTYHDYS
jgi:lactaldehyde dehydrogenase / glycolaldehyde dehydrogenase